MGYTLSEAMFNIIDIAGEVAELKQRCFILTQRAVQLATMYGLTPEDLREVAEACHKIAQQGDRAG